ncbi:T6SS immunity protein Tli4 family protein [Acinetobacter nematophilus]|uniref:T6SS immunity protein Tli4 family protein n=1 Tax=Acinetobacter TaxID=469 RepID=UPI0025835943|nr:T6SS immunity protein Tli4 family protein [Acinetobacter sp.]
MIKRLFTVLLLSSALSVSGCGYAANSKESEAGKTMIDLNNMKDWCVGRYTFKLPKDAEMIDESINYDSFKIESKTKATIANFDEAINEVESKYSTKEDFIKDKTPVEAQGSIIYKIIWGHSTFAQGRTPVHVYAFVYDQSLRILFKITGTYSKKFEKESIDSVKYLVKNLKARNNNKLPTEQGICLKNGFIRDDGKNYKFTRQKVGFKFTKAPSVVISAETEAIYKIEDDLLTRTEKNLQKSPNYLRVKNQTQDIKKGSKTVNPNSPIQGLELITQVPMDGGTGIIATWEHAGTVNSALDPLISMTVDTARASSGINTSSIPNHNGILIYEAILNSLRKFEDNKK